MASYDYNEHEASLADLLALLNVLTREKYPPEISSFVSEFDSLWRSILSQERLPKQTVELSLWGESEVRYYKLTHHLTDIDIAMYFNIDEVHRLIQKHRIPFNVMRLSDCLHLIHYTETGSMEITADAFNEPVIVAYMLAVNELGQITTGEVIDGNHRVSAAMFLKRNIDVAVLNTSLLPPSAFKNMTSCVLYGMLSGIKIIVGGAYPDEHIRTYLMQLKRYASLFLRL